MKRLLIISTLLFFLFSCAQKEKVLTKQDYLDYFESIKGRECISGEFIRWNYNASLEEISTTYGTSGVWIGMLGADYYGNFQDSLPAPKCEYQLTNNVIDSYYEKNGLVNLSVHFINPQTGGSAWDNVIDFDSLLIDGSRIQENFLTELDSVAAGLEDLQNRGIMVMFRPFHEMNGGWFWWGKRENYVDLWKLTHNYMVNEKGLNNLLWCWSPDAGPGDIDAYYPGDEYVDMLGLDAYGSDLPKIATEEYKQLIEYGKPFGFSEYGCVSGNNTEGAAKFDYSVFLDWLKKDFPEAVYFLVWRDHWGFNGKQGVDVLLNDPLIINKEEMMELKTHL